MTRCAYVNGRYLPHGRAAVHIEDRGYQFADGVYEVIAVAGGRLIDAGPHLDRLNRSLAALEIALPMAPCALRHVIEEVRRRNHVRDGMIYLQVTRGVARRDHGFPRDVVPSIVVTARRMIPDATITREGCDVISLEDIRWRRCDIKALALLPNVLAKQQARSRGAFEAILVDAGGHVTEGTSTNVWLVDAEGRLVTHPADHAILDGVTRRRVMRLARDQAIPVEERTFPLEELRKAREMFLTSTTGRIMPVRSLDGKTIGMSCPGPVTRQMIEAYAAYLGGEEQNHD